LLEKAFPETASIGLIGIMHLSYLDLESAKLRRCRVLLHYPDVSYISA
jgi:hypothetical protein